MQLKLNYIHLKSMCVSFGSKLKFINDKMSSISIGHNNVRFPWIDVILCRASVYMCVHKLLVCYRSIWQNNFHLLVEALSPTLVHRSRAKPKNEANCENISVQSLLLLHIHISLVVFLSKTLSIWSSFCVS